MLPTPKSTLEKILKNLAHKAHEEQPDSDPTPITNIEKYLTYFYSGYQTGGGTTPQPEKPVLISTGYDEITSGKTLSITPTVPVGTLIIVAGFCRHTDSNSIVIGPGWTLLAEFFNNHALTGNIMQKDFVYYKFATGSDSFTATQPADNRIALSYACYMTMNAPQVVSLFPPTLFASGLTIQKPTDDTYVHCLFAGLWATSAPYPVWSTDPETNIVQFSPSSQAQNRLALSIDNYGSGPLTIYSTPNSVTNYGISIRIT